MWVARRIMETNIRALLFMTHPNFRIAMNVWFLCSLSGFLAFYGWFFMRSLENVLEELGVLVIVITLLNIACIVLFIIDTYYICISEEIPECLNTIAVCVHLIYSALSIYIFIVLILDHNNLGWVFASVVYAISIIHTVNVLVWVAVMPFLLIGLIVEFVVHLFICRMNCPRQEREMTKYNYVLFKFNQTIAKAATQCSICLEAFTVNSHDICIIACKTHHIFHEQCIFEWLKSNPYCPVCRSYVVFVKEPN